MLKEFCRLSTCCSLDFFLSVLYHQFRPFFHPGQAHCLVKKIHVKYPPYKGWIMKKKNGYNREKKIKKLVAERYGKQKKEREAAHLRGDLNCTPGFSTNSENENYLGYADEDHHLNPLKKEQHQCASVFPLCCSFLLQKI